MKDCGSCINFVKWTNDKWGGGLCECFDVRTKTDHGRGCESWKAIPYSRKEKHKPDYKKDVDIY